MTQYEMTEKLSEKCNVTLEEAKNALENGDWNMLTATHLLEQEKFRRMQQIGEVVSFGTAMAVQAAPEPSSEDDAEAVEQAAEVEEAKATAERAPKAEGTEGAARVGVAKRNQNKGFKNLFDHIRRLVDCGNRNRFEVRRGGEPVLELPVTGLVLALVFAFWVCLPLLAIGLFTGCRYSFDGRDLGRANINGALDKAADAADRVKHSVAGA